MSRPGLIILLLSLWAPMAAAHPLHSQVTELEWNPDSRRYEVAMRLDAAGLEDALSARTGRRVRLEVANFDTTVLQNYLSDSFDVTQGSAKQSGESSGCIHWAGLELELHSVWLYFEYEPENANANAKKRNRPDEHQTAAAGQPQAVRRDRVRNVCLLDVRPQSVHSIQLKTASQTLFGHCDVNTPWVGPQRRSQSVQQATVSSLIATDPQSETPSE